MAACRATTEPDVPTAVVPGAGGRHTRGTWTPQVVPGSGGRRYLREAPAAEAATVAVTAGATTPVAAPAGARRIGRAPIRYAPVPGSPLRTTLAVWGPPRPAWG